CWKPASAAAWREGLSMRPPCRETGTLPTPAPGRTAGPTPSAAPGGRRDAYRPAHADIRRRGTFSHPIRIHHFPTLSTTIQHVPTLTPTARHMYIRRWNLVNDFFVFRGFSFSSPT